MHALTPYPITPVGCFLGVVLTLLPLTSHIRKLGLGVWGFALWTASANLILFVNTLLWHDNIKNIAPIWCDITTKLQFGANFGIAGSSSAVSFQLYKITHRRAFLETRRQRRKTIVCELFLIVVFPVLLMGLSIIVQPFRYQIVEELGCTQTYYSYVAYFTTYVPTILLDIPCLILAPLTTRIFRRHRKEMDEFLSSGQGISRSKYNRLMIMTCLGMKLVPISFGIIVFHIVLGKKSPLNHPFISWKNVHYDGGGGFFPPGSSLSSVLLISASTWSIHPGVAFAVKMAEWFYVVVAILFFALFGTTPEMVQNYRSALWFVPERLGYKRVRTTDVETISDVAFNSNPDRNQRVLPRHSRRRGSSFLLETMIDFSDNRSIAMAEDEEERVALAEIRDYLIYSSYAE